MVRPALLDRLDARHRLEAVRRVEQVAELDEGRVDLGAVDKGVVKRRDGHRGRGGGEAQVRDHGVLLGGSRGWAGSFSNLTDSNFSDSKQGRGVIPTTSAG
eukprot:scaffold2885_cov65-Phaeocystis_antarctica.AAC.7